MKKVMIVGEHSYIGCSFYQYAKERFEIKLVSSRDGAWRKEDFHGYDTLLHCAGIAHVSQKKAMRDLYFSVNRDLAVEVAKKAKAEGVSQFIFLSSMSVYGLDQGVITKDTIPQPKEEDYYGSSKYEAERLLQQLEDDEFYLVIARPPMVYGPDCKGNFPRLVRLIQKVPVFPEVKNQRSMIYIDNLSEFFSQCIEQQISGVFCPQNEEYVCTSELARLIAKFSGKKLLLSGQLGRMAGALAARISVFGKLFGSLTYEMTNNWNNQCSPWEKTVENSLKGRAN